MPCGGQRGGNVNERGNGLRQSFLLFLHAHCQQGKQASGKRVAETKARPRAARVRGTRAFCLGSSRRRLSSEGEPSDGMTLLQGRDIDRSIGQVLIDWFIFDRSRDRSINSFH